MELSALLTQLTEQPENVVFAEVIATIDAYYDFTPTAFDNGETRNEANQNNGSCKIFAFAQLNQLSPEATLACFGDFYRQDVLQHPENDDHQNIRNFIRLGWDGVKFEGVALTAK
ncbi:HopJ type III effector protein [Vibrio fluvialis]|nr:HopJ type III effector protein [Vibrio fluvialis]EKO3460155.1 HopJ type III effector protein [Vibrio fluvialis]EKO3476019.1 HopJ type III effector protein [Vibrio fluvialis]ELG2042032.1 HopJ type III effector protein [Vibrio fluvialis]EMA2480656.1 HopJ type III effector protein [Vibrio fluvialis]